MINVDNGHYFAIITKLNGYYLLCMIDINVYRL